MKKEDILIWAIAGSLLFPPLINIGSLSLRLDDIILLMIAPFYISKIKKNSPFFLFTIFLCCIIISTFYGYLFFDVPSSIRDFNEFIRMFKYIPAIILASTVTPVIFWEKFDKMIFYGTIILISITFIELTNIANLGYILGNLYSSEGHTASMFSETRRIILTGGDPNIGGFIGIYFFVYYLLKILIEKQYKKAIYCLFLLFAILSTQSRTCFISLIIIIIFLIIIDKHIRNFDKIVVIFILSAGIIFLFKSEMLLYITSGLNQFNYHENTSMLTRYNIWEENLRLIKESIWFGWGPAKSIYSTIVDGEYILLFRRYGIIGFGVILFLFLKTSIISYKKNDFHGKYLLLISIASYIFMYTNNFLSGYQLFTCYIIIASINWNEYYKNNLQY